MIITNNLGLPQAFVEMASSEYQYKDKQYSVTSLLRGLRETMLLRKYHNEIEMDVSDAIWMLFGQATHHILEQQQEADHELTEEYLKISMGNGYTLSGRFDLYNERSQTITDYKTSSVWKVIFGDFADWRKQLLIYGWMLRHIGFEVSYGQVVALLKDHSKAKAKREKDYPKLPVFVKVFPFNCFDFQETEGFLRRQFNNIAAAEQMADDELPVCLPEERWATPDKYAVMKKGRKSALRVLDGMEEATEWIKSNGKGEWVEHRIGEDRKCEDYCSVNNYCEYYLSKKEVPF